MKSLAELKEELVSIRILVCEGFRSDVDLKDIKFKEINCRIAQVEDEISILVNALTKEPERN